MCCFSIPRKGFCRLCFDDCKLDGTVLAISHDKNLYCVDAKTGKKRWGFTMERGSSSTPVLGPDGTVFASRLDGKLFAVDSRVYAFKQGTAREALKKVADEAQESPVPLPPGITQGDGFVDINGIRLDVKK
ncbi:MAG: hypothetical protein RDV48_18750 [Candidatus Eremiobacteraeota bacterium]|nr:hypothetical protein [Candidatus Eremiobacteraeota bacterium]